MSPGSHLADAFLNRWNLLAFVGSCGFCLLSGRPDVFLPFVLAAELAYVGASAYGLSGFKNTEVSFDDLSPQELVRRIEKAISAGDFQRYERLRARCEEMREIGSTLQQMDAAGQGAQGTSELLATLDELLLSYLRLLYSRHVLKEFLAKADLSQIRHDIKRFEAQLGELSEAESSSDISKLRSSAKANLVSSKKRLGNYEKVRSNVELITSQIDGLEAKIQTLAETGIGNREPEDVAKRVEEVKVTVVETEKALQRFEPSGGVSTWNPDSIDLLAPLSPEEEGYAEGDDFVYDEED